MQKIMAYSWPGNIRELMNAVERAIVLARTDLLDAAEIALIMEDSAFSVGAGESDQPPQNLSLEDVEKKSILDALATCGGNKSEAARRLGITRKTLRAKLQKYQTD